MNRVGNSAACPPTGAANISAALQAAWAEYRSIGAKFLAGMLVRSRRRLFADCLRRALAEAKTPKQPITPEVERLRSLVMDLENRDRLGHEGIQRLAAARAELRAAEAEADLASKRKLIASAKGRFCAVTFTKKDGSQRTMKVQPAKLKFHVKGDAATEPGKKATATRTCCPSGTQRAAHLAPSTSPPSAASWSTAPHTNTGPAEGSGHQPPTKKETST